tara:strand:- start:457 stop:651 length:195 start_codon:yes stop_codon:yes gene_type:complete
MKLTPREAAQKEAERTYKHFIQMSKRGTIVIIFVLIFIAWFSDWDTPTNYNGEVYAPMNVGEGR